MSQKEINQESAAELLAIIEEILRGYNANTRGLKTAIQRAYPTWCKRARTAVAHARGQNTAR